jgi:prolyl oligopeptidase
VAVVVIDLQDALAEEWMRLDKLQPARYSAIHYEHGRVFYKKTLGGENVGKLYFRQGWKGAEKLLFRAWSPGRRGKFVATLQSASTSGKPVLMEYVGQPGARARTRRPA